MEASVLEDLKIVKLNVLHGEMEACKEEIHNHTFSSDLDSEIFGVASRICFVSKIDNLCFRYSRSVTLSTVREAY